MYSDVECCINMHIRLSVWDTDSHSCTSKSLFESGYEVWTGCEASNEIHSLCMHLRSDHNHVICTYVDGVSCFLHLSVHSIDSRLDRRLKETCNFLSVDDLHK